MSKQSIGTSIDTMYLSIKIHVYQIIQRDILTHYSDMEKMYKNKQWIANKVRKKETFDYFSSFSTYKCTIMQ